MAAAWKQVEIDLELPHGFKNDMTDEGWTVISDTPTVRTTLVLSEFLERGKNGRIYGDEMLERGQANARRIGPLAGQRQAEALVNQSKKIPTSWRRHHTLVFAGTIWRNPKDGSLRVPCLSWCSESRKWKMEFLWFSGSGWGENNERLVHVLQR